MAQLETKAGIISEPAVPISSTSPQRPSQPFNLLPSEVVDEIMGYLPKTALQQCRLVDLRMSKVVTRHLFRALRIYWHDEKGTTDEFQERFKQILGRPDLVDHIRAVDIISSEDGYDEATHNKDLLSRLAELNPRIDTAAFEILSKYMFQCLFGDFYSSPFLSLNNGHCAMWSNVETLKILICDWAYSEFFPYASLDGLCGISKVFPQVRTLHLGLFAYDQVTLLLDDSGVPLSWALMQGFYPHLRELHLDGLASHADFFVRFLARHKDTLEVVSLKGLCLYVIEPEEALNALGQILRLILLMRETMRLLEVRLLGNMTLESRGAKGIVLTVTDRRSTRSGSGDGVVPGSTGLRYEIEEFICHRGHFPFPELRPHTRHIIDNDVKSEHWEEKMVYVGKGDDRLALPVRTDETWTIR
jgi:hypothetical protein